MRTLAVDLGARRVGLALSDAGGQYATPYDVLTVGSPGQAANEVAQVIEKEGVERLIVGVPINMDESVGPAAREAVRWGRAIAEKTGCPIVFVDERLSTFAADQVLNDRKRAGEKLTRKRRKEQLDAVAAAGFLQAFLDGQLPAYEPSALP